MTIDKLYTLFDFISLFSSVTDSPLKNQSPDYICEKFKQYIGEFEKFEFPTNYEINSNDTDFITSYMSVWGGQNYLSVNKYLLLPFVNLLIFLSKANWDSGTLPSRKLELFKQYIGDYNLIKEHEEHGVGLHELLNRWLDDLVKDKRLQPDLTKLKRQFDIDNILND